MRRLLIGLALCALAGSSWAGEVLYVVSNFRYSLVDMIPNDGIAPAILTEQQAPNAFDWTGTTTVGTEVLISYDLALSLFAYDNGDAAVGEWLFMDAGIGGGPIFNFEPCCGPDYFHPTLRSELLTYHFVDLPINDVGLGTVYEPTFRAYASIQVDCCGSGGFPYPPLEPLQPIPEPSTYALMLGGLGLLAFKHKHRRSAKSAGCC